MKTPKSYILTINGGSSSIKFALFDVDDSMHRSVGGEIERIGQPKPILRVKSSHLSDSFSKPVAALDQTEAASSLLDWIEKTVGLKTIVGIGHRIVHGGAKYISAQKVSREMLEELHKLIPLDPEHLLIEIELIEAFSFRLPSIVQVACFDTAFHKDLPKVARLLPIPRRYYDLGVRRYGFHGLSYSYLMSELEQLGGSEASQGRVILAHLGNGASLAAVHHGKSMDTSMGFTPSSGIPMSTRSGDLDPGIVRYLANTEGYDAKRFDKMVNFESGLLGISETSSDVRDLLECEKNDLRAAEAIALFCYQIKKGIGAYIAALGGLDTLVFSGGIGENAPSIRSKICEGLEFLGIKIEEKKNKRNENVISTETASLTIRVICTNEEWMIANTVFCILGLVINKKKNEKQN